MTMGQREVWEKERIELEKKMRIRADELLVKEEILTTVEIMVHDYYVIGEGTARETLDKICEIIFPDTTEKGLFCAEVQSSASTANKEGP